MQKRQSVRKCYASVTVDINKLIDQSSSTPLIPPYMVTKLKKTHLKQQKITKRAAD